MGIVSIAIMLALPTFSASNESLSDLHSSISGFDDPRMNSEDLAFYLATHNFDATPKGGYVEVDLSGNVYNSKSIARLTALWLTLLFGPIFPGLRTRTPPAHP